MIARHISRIVLGALADTPVVFIRGARQTGKTTLVKELGKSGYPAHYITLDSATTLSAASSDPTGFIGGLEKPVIIDEVQRVPNLLLAIKEEVDRNKQPGRYLLTGSANVLTIPRVSDSLAGRMEVITLWPLSQGELEGVEEHFLEMVFKANLAKFKVAEIGVEGLAKRITTGGYPEPVQRINEKRRAAWFNSYLTTIIERDVKELANIHDITVIPRLLRLLASRTSTIRDQSGISRSMGIPNTSVGRYLSLLETIFLIQMLPAWTTNIGKQVIKSPRILFSDTGLACHLLGVDASRLASDHTLAGSLFENFVVTELHKQASWCELQIRLYHFRSLTGQEVDLVLEDRARRICGIEIKLTATASSKHLNGLKSLREFVGKRFVCGVILYAGNEIVPFGEKLFAIPVSALWLN